MDGLRRPGRHESAGSGRPGWWLVLPVKGGPDAKSRLQPPAGTSRPQLARAMALDTVAATVACPEVAGVVVVTSDPETTRDLAGLSDPAGDPSGAPLVSPAELVVRPDPGRGLAAAIQAGLAAVRSGPVGVLLADLPALRPEDLGEALRACAAYPSAYVPDADGTGTVLLAARDLAVLHPAFGVGSADRHARRSVRLDLGLPRLRRDVDDASSLAEASALGVGAHTRIALRPSLAG